MDINFIIAQVFGVLGIITSVVSMHFKKRRTIFIALLLLTVFSILNYVFLGEISGTYISLFAILEMGVNFLFERKKKPVPKPIIAFYIIANIAIGALTFKGFIDVFPIIAALIFCFTLLTKDEQNIRKEMFCNQVCWLVYDFSVGAYAFGVSNILTLVSTAIAIYRFSKKNKVKKGKNDKRPISKAKR